MKNIFTRVFFFLLLSGHTSFGQQNASIKEYKKIFTTYPFSDPNPIADPSSKIYPYFRYDGFTDKPIQREWKVVELENDFLKVTILPEVGGKIWSAIEKSTGKSFIYNNHVVKFRDVAMRGPWTSGGIEANYGIFGHTPNCATPVDYVTRQNDDGSVSCIIGVLDLLTQTPWRLEINLPKDKAYFTTHSFWYNETPMEQPYYTWMNTGIKAKGNLEFVYPGTKYIGHEGEYSDWPINRQNGKKISFYEQNNFGGYKSYHVFGKYTDFFGAYWHDDEFGMARYAAHDDKAGKKIWIWGLSQQGMIWEHLLSDTDGQYVEVQSGRLFNQSADGSTLTPFKHVGFAPYASDSWTEYWFPVKQTKGFVKANNYGALNIKNENGWLKIYFSALQNINDELTITEGEKIRYKKTIHAGPMQLFADSLRYDSNIENLTVTLGDKMIYESSPKAGVLSRPVESPKNFDWNSVYGLYLQGKENIRQRYYAQAEEKLKACLDKDSNYLPAIAELASLQYRNMQYEMALATVKRALSIDTYDAMSNFYYGLINAKLKNTVDAKDGFDIASLNDAYRTAAYTELSKLYFIEKNFSGAIEYAEKSLITNQYNIEAYEISAVANRLLANETAATKALDKIIQLDGLNHVVRFEKYLWHPSQASKNDFVTLIRNEMPSETYLQTGIFYYQLGCIQEALQVFSAAPQNVEILYWKAFLENKNVDTRSIDPNLSFPFRAETAVVLEKLISQNDGWLLKYHLALIWWSRNNTSKAKQLFEACGDKPDYAPFYATKAKLFPEDAEANLLKAVQLDKQQWRFYKSLCDFYIGKHDYDKALAITEPYYMQHTGNFIMGMQYAKTLVLNKKYAACDALLNTLDVIPFEGATDARKLYHESKLMQAVAAMKNKKYKDALTFVEAAKAWPQNLGVGKPYQNEIDERLENWLSYLCYHATAKNTEAQRALQRIIDFTPKTDNTVDNFLMANHLVTAWTLERMHKKQEAVEFLDDWKNKNPSDVVLAWCIKRFNHTDLTSAEASINNETVRILEEVMAAQRSGLIKD